jgi:uncharacterized protein YoxC
MPSRRQKILGYFAMFLSIDVLVAAALSIIVTWVSFSATNNLLASLFQAGEKATAAANSAITTIDNTMVTFGNKASALSQDVAQIGQNVADQGVIRNLLPPDKEAALTEKVAEIKQIVSQVKQAVDSVQSFMSALRALPFIQVPSLDESIFGKLDSLVTQIEGLVNTVRQGLADLRNGVAGALDQVSQALAEISNAVFEARFSVAQLQAYVQSANQVILPFLQAATPIFFIFIGLLLSLLYGWTIFVMFCFFRWANAYRKGRISKLTSAPVAAVPTEPSVSSPAETPPPAEKQS